MENMNKYLKKKKIKKKKKKITQKLIKEEIAVLFCPEIIYLLPETYLPRGNLMVIFIIYNHRKID